MKQYITNGINTSPTRVGEAAADMEEAGGKIVKFDKNGLIVLCDTKGEKPIGIVTIDNTAEVKTGEDVSYQIFGVGLAGISEDVKAGDELTPDANGTLAKAASGDFVCAVAMKNCGAGSIGTVEVVNYYKSTASTKVNEIKEEQK